MPISDIITGQFVYIEQTPASIGDRIMARVIDAFVVGVFFAAVTQFLSYTTKHINDDTAVIAFVIIAYMPVLMYTFLSELLFGGRTIGKYAMHTQVVMADGSAPTAGALFLRYVCEIVDIGFMCLGLIFILCTKRHQRLGDMAAGTLVIRQRDAGRMRVSLDEFAYARRDFQPTYPAAASLNERQAEVISRALLTAERNNKAYERLDNLAAKVSATLKVKYDMECSAFLTAVLNDYKYYKAMGETD